MLAYMSYCKLKKNNLGEATGQWIPFVAVILELEETILAKDNSFESKRWKAEHSFRNLFYFFVEFLAIEFEGLRHVVLLKSNLESVK